jgi:L,D-transpeptidase YcbB
LNYLITILLAVIFFLPGQSNTFVMNAPSTGTYNDSYHKLRKVYGKLSRDEWPLPGNYSLVKLNDTGDVVLQIKKYLRATGDLKKRSRSYLRSDVFDKTLEEAVKEFQLRHGLKADGIAGEKTMEKMNTPLSERLTQIQANIERMKELPVKMGDRFIIVNIPGFYMEYFEEGNREMLMNVVVGTIENYTPVFHDTMTYVVFNPEWNVPVSITLNEIIPAVQSNQEYLDSNNYVLLKDTWTSGDTIPPSDIDWDKITEENLPFRVVQLPGKTNSLGRIKFMFPNNYNIYLHDTPANQLFDYETRAFSHGCIRLEKPVELAELLFEGQMEAEEIKEILENEETVSTPLDNPVVVHLLYHTAWIDEEGRLNFRDDIYELDKQSVSELKAK